MSPTKTRLEPQEPRPLPPQLLLLFPPMSQAHRLPRQLSRPKCVSRWLSCKPTSSNSWTEASASLFPPFWWDRLLSPHRSPARPPPAADATSGSSSVRELSPSEHARELASSLRSEAVQFLRVGMEVFYSSQVAKDSLVKSLLGNGSSSGASSSSSSSSSQRSEQAASARRK